MPGRHPDFPLEADDRAGQAPVREALVERARERVRVGFYDRAEVTRALVEALLSELATT